MLVCKRCNADTVVKNGLVRSTQRYRCKACHYNFIPLDKRIKENLKAKKALALLLYGLGKGSYSMLGKIFGVNRSLIYRWIKQAAAKLPFRKWIIKALDRTTRRAIGWVIGKRDSATFKRLYDKVKHLKRCKFYTDDWEGFKSILPKKRHIIGKAYTTGIEQDNSNTRDHLARMTRRTKVVTKKEEMLDASLKIWHALTDRDMFRSYQDAWLSIFA
jgi:insertion element IS1 protein InsB